MGSAAGSAVSLVLLDAVSSLSPSDFYVYRIPGMTAFVQANAFEYLYLCQTRVETPISLPGYIKNIVVSSIEQFLALCTYLLSFSASLYLATVTYYSSAIVHKEALKPGIRTVFEKSNIEVRRISVGCSCIQLISSVSPLF